MYVVAVQRVRKRSDTFDLDLKDRLLL
jgi:hypothetical protein